MAVPVYAVTGFLDAGKTTFLNNLLSRRDWRDIKILLVQFESGETEFQSRYRSHQRTVFSKRDLERRPDEVAHELAGCIHETGPDELWIEWNGVAPFSQLQDLLRSDPLREVCALRKVLHIADAGVLEGLLGSAGAALTEQVASSDVIALRGVKSGSHQSRLRRQLREVNPGVPVCGIDEYGAIGKRLFCREDSPVVMFLLAAAMVVTLFYFLRPLSESVSNRMNTVINYFLGMILQAIPFLLIGVLLSSAIQVLVPREVIERRFPKSLGLGMLAAVLGGFFLPVCDCASIPVFRGLVKKGVPLPAAVTFMAATPVINPVVILSTYYAFGYDIAVAAQRVLLGILVAVLVGLSYAVWPPKGEVLSGGGPDRILCSCGCYEGAGEVTTIWGKLGLWMRHAQAEFFSVGKFLVIGCFISALFQALGTGLFTWAQGGVGSAVSIAAMMVMAFILSLCSSSDAVIARSLSGLFSSGSIMGFLVFGPMMDIKNVLMLSSGFSRRFILRLVLTVFAVCFLSVYLLAG